MIRYYKLFDLLNRRGMKKIDLLQVISRGTLAKLSKGGIIQTDVIQKICDFLDCQPGDIMENISDYSEPDKDGNIIYTKKVIHHPGFEDYDEIELSTKDPEHKSE